MTYQNQMTGEHDHTGLKSYELWDLFAEHDIRRFGPTHEEKKPYDKC